MKKRLVALTVAALGLSPVILTAPAEAVSYRDCAWPHVCLYNGAYATGTKLSQYKVPGYQNMAKSHQNRADSVVNTRNDDSVWLMDTGPSPDRYLCIPRNTRVNLKDYAHPRGGTWANKVDTIRIWGDPDNGLCSGTTQVRQGSVRDGWRG